MLKDLLNTNTNMNNKVENNKTVGGGESNNIVYDIKGLKVFDVEGDTYVLSLGAGDVIYNLMQNNLKADVARLAQISSGIVVLNAILDDLEPVGLVDSGLHKYFGKHLFRFKEKKSRESLFSVLPKQYHNIVIKLLHDKGIGTHEASLSDGTKVLINCVTYMEEPRRKGRLDISINGRKQYECEIQYIRNVVSCAGIFGYTLYNSSNEEICGIAPHTSKVVTNREFSNISMGADEGRIKLVNPVRDTRNTYSTYPLLSIKDRDGSLKEEYRELYEIEHNRMDKNSIKNTKTKEVANEYLTVLSDIRYKDKIIGYMVTATGKSYAVNMIRTIVNPNGTLYKSNPTSQSIEVMAGEVQLMTKDELKRLFVRLKRNNGLNDKFNYTLVKNSNGGVFLRPKESSNIQKIEVGKRLSEFSKTASMSKEAALVYKNINIFGADLPLKYFES